MAFCNSAMNMTDLQMLCVMSTQAYNPLFVLQTCANYILMATLVVCEYDIYGFLTAFLLH